MALITSNRGFTYIAALMAVVIMGIMLGAGGQSWKTAMQREKEKELLFRGIEIRNALVRWHSPQGRGQSPHTRLNDLKDLLKDPRTPGTVKYLRRLYKDPITGKDWQIVTHPVWGVIGVFSASEAQPLKKGNFPKELKAFEGKTKYSEWQFVWQEIPTVPGSTGSPGAAAVPGTSTTSRFSEGP